MDEVDSILIDEARTFNYFWPSNESADYYVQIKKIIPKLKEQLRENWDEPLLKKIHYIIDEKNRSID